MLSSLSTHPFSALSFPHLFFPVFPFSAWTFHLCVKPPYIPGQIKVLAPLPPPFGHLLGLTIFLLQKGHGHSPCLQRAQEPKALKHRGRLTSHEYNPQCPDDHCRLSCLVITKGTGTEVHIPKPAPLCPWPSLNPSNSSISHCIVSIHNPNLVSSL